MQEKLNVQRKMILRHCWLKDFMPLTKKSILTASFLSFGFIVAAEVYAAENGQTHDTVLSTQKITQASKKLTGKVLDAKGESVIGATIKVKGTAQGAITDIDGITLLYCGMLKFC